MKRAFLAINPPPEVKETLFLKTLPLKEDFRKGAVKWVEKENIHLTLLFLGLIKETKKIEENLSQINFNPFEINLSRISYFPEDRRKARMIWARGEEIEELTSLFKKVKEKTGRSQEDFTLHITLARLKTWEMKKTPLEEIPYIEEDLDIQFPVTSFELMESKLKKEGPEYKVIKSFSAKT